MMQRLRSWLCDFIVNTATATGPAVELCISLAIEVELWSHKDTVPSWITGHWLEEQSNQGPWLVEFLGTNAREWGQSYSCVLKG